MARLRRGADRRSPRRRRRRAARGSGARPVGGGVLSARDTAEGSGAAPVAIALDVGGTFTDVVACWSGGQVRTTKLLSSVGLDPQGLAAHLARWLAEVAPADATSGGEPRVVHGSTVATNALLEGKTARTLLIATEGFRDTLELARGIRPDPLDLAWRPLPPLVPRDLRLTVGERIGADGEIVEPLRWSVADQEATAVAGGDVEAIAVCLLNSHANSEHESSVATTLRERLPDAFVCASHEVNPEPREYERASTTVVNAALGPVVDAYLDRLEDAFEMIGLPRGLDVIQSNGGTISSALAKRRPVTIVESGPAAGVLAAGAIARLVEDPGVISFDMGGTTAKASLIERYEILESSEYYVGGGLHAGPRAVASSGYVIRMPTLDVSEVGAGGGSIARLDEAGGLAVGPDSAGALPGPAAYGLGGNEATVTDANVVLGYINPTAIAGGEQSIDLDLARAAIERAVAGPKGLGVEEAALLIHTGANARMLAAVRSVTIERGRDPREHSIVAFGGSGPVHAAGIADLLGVPRVLVPFGAGVLSATGLLAAGPAADAVMAHDGALAKLDLDRLPARFDALRSRMAADYGLAADAVERAEELVSIRYRGQSTTEVYVPFVAGDGGQAAMRADFERTYRTEFGFVKDDAAPEVTGLRLRLRGAPDADWHAVLAGLGDAWRVAAASSTTRRCVFAGSVGDAPVIGMRDLDDSGAFDGPAIVEAPDTTVVVPPGWTAAPTTTGIELCRTQ